MASFEGHRERSKVKHEKLLLFHNVIFAEQSKDRDEWPYIKYDPMLSQRRRRMAKITPSMGDIFTE